MPAIKNKHGHLW